MEKLRDQRKLGPRKNIQSKEGMPIAPKRKDQGES